VIELGMNHPGEIGSLARIAAPTVALVNNAQREHQEFMATVEAVARENGSVFEALPPSGVAVFPTATPSRCCGRRWPDARPCMTFGDARDTDADVFLAGSEWHQGHWRVGAETPAGAIAFRLHIAGRHNVRNALAAAACALAAGVPLQAIQQGLEAFEPVKGRSRALGVALDGRTLTVVDDSYNANPDSVRAAIDVLAELPGPRLLVLGDMGEVGNQGPAFHARSATTPASAASSSCSRWASRRRACRAGTSRTSRRSTPRCCRRWQGTESVLVKGSRFMKMERVVEAIAAHARQQDKGRPDAR
jgi:UDP-N-acetylmuramoyl-tripeptide--D-alanyl-D-alanine ligase